MTLNTLRLLRDILGRQTLNANAPRADIEAVLTARDELDRAIEEAEAEQPATSK